LLGRELEPGEMLARDLYFLERDEGGELRPWVRGVERATFDACDLGVVYGPGGEVLGRLVEMDGSMLTWERAAGRGECAPGSAAPCDPAA
jgi:hypothetical protein